MEVSGNNRYELLFMDDDGSAPAPAKTEPKKKQAQQNADPSAAAAKKTVTKKSNVVAEKENKSSALNKNTVGKSVVPNNQNAKPKQNPNPAGGRNKNASANEDGGRSVTFRPQNGEAREQRNNRRNNNSNREGGYGNTGGNEYGNDQRPPRQFRDRENRGPPRNRTNGEGGYRKREFDRQSGSDKTGVKAVDKRDGAGAHNWGSVQQEIKDLNKSTSDGDAALTDKEESANDQSAELANVPEEEEAKEMTLDEWKASRKERAKPQFNLRKAGEGEDTSQWKKMVVLTKKKEGDSEEEFEYDPSMYPQRVGRLQRIVDIQFNFNDNRRRRGPRPGGDRPRFEGGRPGPTGENNRPRNFGERQRGGAHAPKVDDERQFPTLS
ncbi:plasminogen activator inhibitor 1 RNA-binding protein [Teleopsis dalmanni]|uniref:plasminogen activator inhibitor 1 RNA-binding protein n=1 Tax=Teleopsis dalmanni TaxID=139649 RepID=UPI0018CDBFCB|nr:plasminogen activator inhibitor 1 RNA-binding protein [Teleopsis dalmanni]